MNRTTRISAFLLVSTIFFLACATLTRPFVQTPGPQAQTPGMPQTPGLPVQTPGQPGGGKTGAFTLLGQLGGSAFAVAQKDNYLYLGQGPRLVVLDVSQPETPKWVGQSQVLPGSVSLVAGVVTGIQISGNYAYVAAFSGGLHILDISQPAAPKLVSSVYPNNPPGCAAIALQGDTAYLACNPSGLFIVDISNPQKPVVLSSNKFTGANASIAVSGKTVYLSGYDSSSSQSGLLVVDVSDPANPTQVGFLSVKDIPGEQNVYRFMSVRVCGSTICMSAAQAGVVVLDISTPANPKIASVYQDSTIMAESLTVDGDRMYVIDDLEGLYVLDISDPAHPKQIGMMPTDVGGFEFSLMEAQERGLLAAAGRLWITDPTRGLVVVDVSNPSNPQRIGHYQTPVPDWLMDIAVQGDYAYIAGRNSGFRVVDISDPQTPRELSYNDKRYPESTGLSLSAVQVRDNYAYVTDLNFPFRIYDVSDPSQPSVVSEIYDFAASDGAFDLELVGNTVYLTGWGLKDAFYPGEGLWLIDVSDPTKAKAVKFVDIPNTNSRLDAEGNYLYVLDGSQHCDQPDTLSLRIFDTSDERNPAEVSVWPVTDQKTLSYDDILVKDQILYISSGTTGMDILDVHNPTQPARLSNIPYGIFTKSALEGNTLFMQDLMAYDISNPKNPVMTNYILATTGQQATRVVGDSVYVVTLNDGLFIFKFKP